MREADVPRSRAALRSDETWTLTWEGSLSLDKADTAIDGPASATSQMFVDGAGMHIVDQTQPFCDAGVEPYDIVQLRGCDPSLGDAGCPLGYTCYVHPQSQVTGLGACMLIDEADRLANACKRLPDSLRRYTVGTHEERRAATLLPRKHELRTTPLDGCTDDAQCQSLADYALAQRQLAQPEGRHDGRPIRTRGVCQADPDRAAEGRAPASAASTSATTTRTARPAPSATPTRAPRRARATAWKASFRRSRA